MKSFAALAVFASLASQVYAMFTVSTPPSIVQCQPVLIAWQEGTAPYYPTIIPGGQVSGAALRSFPQTNANQMTWNADLAAGTPITFAVRDATGQQVYSDRVTIADSSDSSCVNAAGSGSVAGSGPSSTAASSSPSTGSSAGAAGGASSAAAATGARSSSATHPLSTSTGAATSHASSSSSSAHASAGLDASTNSAKLASSMNAAGIAGLLGLVGAALL